MVKPFSFLLLRPYFCKEKARKRSFKTENKPDCKTNAISVESYVTYITKIEFENLLHAKKCFNKKGSKRKLVSRELC
jgi:hypothetical protein